MKRLSDFIALYRMFRQCHSIRNAARYAWAVAKDLK